MKHLLLACGFLFVCNASFATDLFVSAVEVLGYGVVESRISKSRMGFSKESMAVDGVDNVRFVTLSRDIPGVLGTKFGLQYRINSTPKGAMFEVSSIIIFPPGGLVNKQGKVFEQASETFEVPVGEQLFYGFGFDEEWEIVPGEWKIQIWHNNARMIERKFNIQLP